MVWRTTHIMTGLEGLQAMQSPNENENQYKTKNDHVITPAATIQALKA